MSSTRSEVFDDDDDDENNDDCCFGCATIERVHTINEVKKLIPSLRRATANREQNRARTTILGCVLVLEKRLLAGSVGSATKPNSTHRLPRISSGRPMSSQVSQTPHNSRELDTRTKPNRAKPNRTKRGSLSFEGGEHSKRSASKKA